MKTGPAAVSALAVAAVLAGCSGDPEPAPTALPPLPSASPRPSASLPSASPVPLPSEAKAATPQGAAAFARYFYATLNAAYDSLDNRQLLTLVDPGCKTCANYVRDIAAAHRKGDRFKGGGFKVRFAEAPSLSGNLVVVLVTYDMPTLTLYNREGAVQLRVPSRTNLQTGVQLQRHAGNWHVVRVVAQ